MPNERDTYLTIKKSAKGIFKDKGSKFISFAHPIYSKNEVKPIVDNYKKEYHDARHHCFAYKTGVKNIYYRTNDDGEPTGTAGKPIYGQILSAGLENVLVVVVRYFGGTLLGVGGLINAYKHAAADAINNATIIEKQLSNTYSISFQYPIMNQVMHLLKKYDTQITQTNFTENCQLKFKIRQQKAHKLYAEFKTLHECKIKLLSSD